MHCALSTSLKAGTQRKGKKIHMSVLQKRHTHINKATVPNPGGLVAQPAVRAAARDGGRRPRRRPGPHLLPCLGAAAGRGRSRHGPGTALPPAEPPPPAGARPPRAHPASRMTLLSPQSQAPPAWLRNML